MTNTAVLAKKVEGIPEGLPPEEMDRLLRVQARLTDFVLHLVQALLRTGYYTPEHPESIKAKEGLYQQFKTLFESEDEISFLIRQEQDKQEVLVEGVLPETQRLGRMMLRGMGELYVPKFVKYLERKDLISLTLKSRMEQEEFTRFVDLMSEPGFVDTRRRQDKDQFAEALLDRGILNISYVFNDEILGSDREMPWRARLTLSRMRKDLKMLPHFQRIWKQEVQGIRKNLLRDALRPIRQSDLLCAVLQNSDLAATAETDEESIEGEVIAFLQRQFLTGTARFFLRDLLDRKRLQPQYAPDAKINRLVRKICQRLKEAETRDVEALLEDYFRNGLIGLDDLTAALQDKILIERLTDKFLDYTESFFQQLDQAQDKEKFLRIALSFVKIIPELIRRDRYSEILRILNALKKHFHERRMWSLLAGQVLEEIGSGLVPEMLRERFLAAKKETRTAIIPIFTALEIGAIPPLLAILKTSDDQWVRKNACEALIQIGPVAAAHLLKELEKQQTSVETTCDILRVLGQIQATEWKAPFLEVLRRYGACENPRLREQALHSLCLTGGAEGEALFLSALEDESFEVQKRSAWCLGRIRSIRGAEKLLEKLDRIAAAPSPETESIETQLYHSLGLFGNLSIGGRTIEQTLLEAVNKRGFKPLWGLFQKNPFSEASLSAISDSLGKIGTGDSIRALTRLAKSYQEPLASKIKEALKKIEERQQQASVDPV
jgi:hypothetical protein